MPFGRLALSLICVAFPICLVTGCQVIDGHRTLTVQVIDGDTRQPVSSAKTRVSYPLAGELFGPGEIPGRTDKDGMVTVAASTAVDSSTLLEIRADGYLPEHRFIPTETVRSIKPSGLFDSREKRPPSMTVELCSEKPAPTIELLVPANFRGVVQVALQIPEGAADLPGQRQFTHAVPESGRVIVTGPAILKRFQIPNFTAKFAEGPAIAREPTNDIDVGLWPLGHELHTFTFMIGNRAELAELKSKHLLQSMQAAMSSSPVAAAERHNRRRHDRQPPPKPNPGP
jgi:hypothetical protein